MIVGHQPSGVPANFRKQLVVDRLKSEGISTVGDLDRWRGNLSRYGALVRLVGSDAADSILNELAVLQCTAISEGRSNV
jgi:hypothetical protein